MKALLLFGGLLLPALVHSATLPPWKEILGPTQAKVPNAGGFTVTWRTNLTDALAEARKESRPLFVTFRCLPCKQCSAFDKEVLEGGPDLVPLLAQFITVRLTDAAAIDFRVFPVEGFADMDLSWWGWFLSPEGKVYGVFGGRDHVSDATRISKPALVASLLRVLAHHYDPRRERWDIDGLAPDLSGSPKSPRELPGYELWRRTHEGERKQNCIHCHQVNDILRQPAVTAKTFDKQRDFDVWPLPENVGLVLDRDHGLLVTNVTAGSAADKVGLKPGDVLGAAGGRRCFSQTDFRGALHRGPRGAGEIEVWWTRGDEAMSGMLVMADGWRKAVLDWRMSVSQGIVGMYPGFFPLVVKPARRDQYKIPAGTMAVEPYMGTSTNSAAYAAGLRGSHVVTAVNGESPDLTGRAFLVWFIQRYDAGDPVTLTVVNKAGEKRDFTYRLPLR
jgi:hypothetical protein